MTSQIDEAIDAQRRRSNASRRLGDAREEGNALRVLSRLLFFAGRASEAEPLVLEAIELLEQLPPGHELAMAYAQRFAAPDGRRGHRKRRRHGVQRALELAAPLGDTEAEVYALSNIGCRRVPRQSRRGPYQARAGAAAGAAHGHEELAGLTFNRLVMFPVRYRRFEIAAESSRGRLGVLPRAGARHLSAIPARGPCPARSWTPATGTEAADWPRRCLRDPAQPTLGAHLGADDARSAAGAARRPRGLGAASKRRNAMVTPPWSWTGSRRSPQPGLRRPGWPATPGRSAQSPTPRSRSRSTVETPWAAGELAYWRRRAGLQDGLPAELVAEPYRLSIAGDWRGAAERWRDDRLSV